MIVVKQQRSEWESALLRSLKTLESLVDTAYNMSVRQSVNGICLSVVAEGAYAYRLAIDAAYQHQRFIFIGEEHDVDCDLWKDKLQKLSRKMEVFDDETAYNPKTITPQTMVSLLAEKKELSDLFKVRKYERVAPIENNVFEYGKNSIDRIAEQDVYRENIHNFVENIDNVIEQETFDLIATDIRNPTLSDEENREYLHNQMTVWKNVHRSAYRALHKVSVAINLLGNATDIRRIPDYMFEDYCQIQLNNEDEAIDKAIIALDRKLSQFTGYTKEAFLTNEIRNIIETLSKDYDQEVIYSFIGTDYIDDKSEEFKGFTLFGMHPSKIPVNLESLGRFVYGMFFENKDDEAKQLLVDICMLARRMQLLKEHLCPSAGRMKWSKLAQTVFKQKAIYNGKEYNVNLDTIYSLCETYLKEDSDGNSTDCRWLALALFAKHWGFLNYKHQKNGKDVFEASTFAELLREWGFEVDANKMSPYIFLLLSDQIKDYKTEELSSIEIPENSNRDKCNPTGVNHIQRFLKLLIENTKINDILVPISLLNVN